MILNFLLLLAISAIIGYIVSPKSFFLPRTYEEGDIILQNIVIEEDLLIPDHVSTRLKKEKLIKEQSPVFEFDPGVQENTVDQIITSFKKARLENDKLAALEVANRKRSFELGRAYFDALQTQQELNAINRFHTKYKTLIRQRLDRIGKDAEHSASEFERKKKLDADLNIVNQMIDENSSKLDYFKAEENTFSDRFKKAEEEQVELQTAIVNGKESIIANFIQNLQISVDETEYRQLGSFPYYQIDIENQLIILLTKFLAKKIIPSKNILPDNGNRTIEIRNLGTGEVFSGSNIQDLYEMGTIKTMISDAVKQVFSQDETGEKRNLLLILANKLIKPTVRENKFEFEKRKEQLSVSMSPVYFSVKKGEIIARAGDRATRHQVEMINSYYNEISKVDNLPRVIGVVLITFVALALVSTSFQVRGKSSQISPRNVILIMSAILITLLLMKFSVLVGDLVETRYSDFPKQIYIYMLPVALSAMLVGILFNFETGLLTGLLTSLFASLMMQSNLYYFFFAIFGSLVAALPVTKFDSRYSLLIHGLKISLINLPVVLILYLIEKNQMLQVSWQDLLAASFGGVFTAVIASILLPFFESIFDITTNLKLLELSNMNHPALKELIFKAPGTYQHSIVVGNLAECGATRIGANPLLARVAAYYHDIGKADKPHYFIENQAQNSTNIHDLLDPKESARIIIGHIQNGVKMAEKFRLGTAIKGIVEQHHGTRLVEYFYSKASHKASGNTDDMIVEDDFRYAGPRPQSLEAALVMLADIAEAACRSIDEPTPESIREMVSRVSWKVLEDGQLNDSGITLQTYHLIVDEFCGVLVNIHHHRIKYPAENPITEIPDRTLKAVSGVPEPR